MIAIPADILSRLGIAVAYTALVFVCGYQVRDNRQDKVEQKQEVKVARIEAKDAADVGNQNAIDQQTIENLERRLADVLAHPREPRIVRVRDPSVCVRPAQGNAGPGEEAGPPGGRPMRGLEDDERIVRRADLLRSQAEKAELRAAIRSCQAQWPH